MDVNPELTCRFVDEAAVLPEGMRAEIGRLAQAAAREVRGLLPLAEHISLSIGPTDAALQETGDNAFTESPEHIRWFYDRLGDPVEIARRHLRQAFFHEAFHAARFRHLGHEAGLERWSNVALGEGLACVFARDHAGAHETWCDYQADTIEAWSRELLAQPWGEFERWKFQHEDGRARIAFRVGVWLVGEILRDTGRRIEDLVWVPLEELETHPAVQRLLPRIPSATTG